MDKPLIILNIGIGGESYFAHTEFAHTEFAHVICARHLRTLILRTMSFAHFEFGHFVNCPHIVYIVLIYFIDKL